MNCRYCNNPIPQGEECKTVAYWNKTVDVCHSQCKQAGERSESIECQTIDADCNDCKHYKRGTLEPKTVSKLHTPDGRIVDVIFQPEVFIDGHCLKFDKPTLAFPNKWTGRVCFEHRRA